MRTSRTNSANTSFLSTPSARRATTSAVRCSLMNWISIHALREEGDLFQIALVLFAGPISIHALREEGDGHRQGSGAGAGHFYPRPPRGGRRSSPPPGHRWSRYFYPRPPRGGRLHKPLPVTSAALTFLSTPSARRATLRSPAPDAPAAVISIHALREEGDVIVGDVLVCCGGISIHALREEGDP